MHQEVTEELPKEIQKESRKTLTTRVVSFFFPILLQPVVKLLQELWAKAVEVISQILGGN
jgi:hypothetical protein